MKLLDTLERLEKAATPGPWEAKQDGEIWDVMAQNKLVADLAGLCPDAQLIAAARNALSALLRVARAAKRVDQIFWEFTGTPEAFDGQVMEQLNEALEALRDQ